MMIKTKGKLANKSSKLGSSKKTDGNEIDSIFGTKKAVVSEYDWDDEPDVSEAPAAKKIKKETPAAPTSKPKKIIESSITVPEKQQIPNSRAPAPAVSSSPSKALPDTSACSSHPQSASTPIDSPLFRLSSSTIAALTAKGITSLFPIQTQTFAPIREGRDLIGRARTGQGKTLAFCLPILEALLELNRPPQRDAKPLVLIMSPTRELAQQIHRELVSVAIKSIRCDCVYGGTSLQENFRTLKAGLEAVVGTPGRLKDLLDKGWLDVSEVRHLVLDEADQMLDMGFQDEIKSIFQALKPQTSAAKIDDKDIKPLQVLLFSATMPKWCLDLSKSYMREDLVYIDQVGESKQKAVTTVRHVAIRGEWHNLGSVINDVIAMFCGRQGRVLVFCATKLDCDTIAMDKAIKHECHVLHGDIPQPKRESTLLAYKNMSFRVLIATDVAARGLDLSVDLVINAKPPMKPLSTKADTETYVHRSGEDFFSLVDGVLGSQLTTYI